jgi:hypothetical protein
VTEILTVVRTKFAGGASWIIIDELECVECRGSNFDFQGNSFERWLVKIPYFLIISNVSSNYTVRPKRKIITSQEIIDPE